MQLTNREAHAVTRFIDKDYSGSINDEEFRHLLLGNHGIGPDLGYKPEAAEVET